MDNIFFQYLEWQFIGTPRGILKGWRNCLKFNLNYWSVVALLKTFFSHWHRYKFSYGKGFDFKRYSEAFIFNIISRVLGAILRSFFIVFGLAVEIFIFLTGLVVILIWLFLPLILISGIVLGFKILF
ncbi:MAG: hypothetical protein HYW69_00365 [Candidatus Nealsonbacteria bacterium]|nr:hypothetical protein [Candidatus Nealsonbacteria bacterium]